MNSPLFFFDKKTNHRISDTTSFLKISVVRELEKQACGVDPQLILRF